MLQKEVTDNQKPRSVSKLGRTRSSRNLDERADSPSKKHPSRLDNASQIDLNQISVKGHDIQLFSESMKRASSLKTASPNVHEKARSVFKKHSGMGHRSWLRDSRHVVHTLSRSAEKRKGPGAALSPMVGSTAKRAA